ncbi:sigma-70 family RNA polymerase sigma factor [Proteinivorax hydrogeniformans]|uniref:RNA polymerase sigma factor n=1 Tax=Proteinivorax hydrogeniformans TaxID=1826727 RepID=A0AAU8HQC3_9FIRM
MQSNFQRANQYPLLSKQEVLDLFERYHNGDEQARETLLNHNLRLVGKVVERYRGVYDSEDLFQIGCIGLLKAIDSFDHKQNVSFSTYAFPKIIGEIKMYFRDNNPIKISRKQMGQSKLVKEAQEELTQKLNRTPQISEIASHLDMTVEDVVVALDALQPIQSLEQPVGEEDDFYLKDQLKDSYFSKKLDNKIFLKEILTGLNEIERKVIILRYFKEKSQSQIAQILDMTQVQVSRLEKKIIQKLKDFAQ